VVTAASCFPSTSSTVEFFWPLGPNGEIWPDDDFTPRANVRHVYEHIGVTPTTNWQDSHGEYFNIAVLELDRDVPWQVPAWIGGGNLDAGSSAFQVGLGAHNNNPQSFGKMAEHVTTLRASGSNYPGTWLLTNDPASGEGTAGTHGGDTGGPLYGWGPSWSADDEGSLGGGGGLPSGQAMTLLGVYSGTNPWDFFGNRAGYTLLIGVVIDFLHEAMGIGPVQQPGQHMLGNVIESFPVVGFTGECEARCLKHHDCVALTQVFTLNSSSPDTCNLLRQVTGWSTFGTDPSVSRTRGTTGPCHLDENGICRL
jgi:hypothetical protein